MEPFSFTLIFVALILFFCFLLNRRVRHIKTQPSPSPSLSSLPLPFFDASLSPTSPTSVRIRSISSTSSHTLGSTLSHPSPYPPYLPYGSPTLITSNSWKPPIEELPKYSPYLDPPPPTYASVLREQRVQYR